MNVHRVWMRGVAEVTWIVRSRQPRAGTRILMYHAVGTPLEHDTYGISISPNRFRDHLETLHNDPRIDLVPLRDARAHGDRLQVVVTFDDGYLDNLTTAAPVLAELQIPFTVFVTSDNLDRGHPTFLHSDDLAELASLPGATIGGHGKTHRRLTECDDASLQSELADSKKRLEDIIGEEVWAISYPNGSVDQRVVTTARRAGYQAGLGSRMDINSPGRDRMALCRTEIWSDDNNRRLLQKVSGAWDWYRWRHPDVA